jgi:hypothetical protein
MLRKFVLPLAIVAGSFLAWHLWAQNPASDARKERLRAFMQQKLEHSKSILEGLAMEDYEKLAKSSQALDLLSMESTWNVLTTEQYLEYSRDFRRSVSSIHKAANDKNLDRASLGFVDMAIRCVDCHKYVRSQR